jgi:hypothetical protein
VSRSLGWAALTGLWLLTGCGGPTFLPPAEPAHDVEHGGHYHAVRLEDPFSCGIAGSPNAKRGTPCPTVRPQEDALLSCDASGCHGGFDFTAAAAAGLRELRGGEGPSCYTCHGEKWKDD